MVLDAIFKDGFSTLKEKHPESAPALFDILSQIQDMTSDKIHEQSWDKWDSPLSQIYHRDSKDDFAWYICDTRSEKATLPNCSDTSASSNRG